MPLPLIILALALGIALGWIARGAVRKDEAARAASLARHDEREARRGEVAGLTAKVARLRGMACAGRVRTETSDHMN